MNNKINLMLIGIVLSFKVMASSPSDSTTVKKTTQDSSYWNNFKIRKSFESLDSKKEPATLSFTAPVGGKASYLVDGGINYSITNKKNNILGVLMEYHRNTLIKKEVNNFQIGIQSETLRNKQIENNNVRSTYFNTTLKYNNNPKSKTEGVVGTFQISWLHDKQPKNRIFHSNSLIRGQRFCVLYSPIIGLEYQNDIKTDSTVLKGTTIRAIAELNFSISPSLKDDLLLYKPSAFEVFANYRYRQNILNTTDVAASNSSLLETGINIRLSPEKDGKISTKLSLSYNRGSNPVAQLAFQEYYLIALKIKL